MICKHIYKSEYESNRYIMITKKKPTNLSKQLINALEWCSKSEDSTSKEVMVDIEVYEIAEKLSIELDTDVEGVFALAAYRIIQKENRPSTPPIHKNHVMTTLSHN